MDEKNIFLDKIKDKYERVLKEDYLMNSDFLSLEEQSMSHSFLRDKRVVLFGGYILAERKEVHFIPSYLDISTEEELISYYIENPYDSPIDVLNISIPKQDSRTLSHRDYLGAILGEGISRSKVGDILVNAKGAQVIVSKDISEYILENLKYVGRVAVSVSLGDISSIDLGEIKKEELKLNVPSVRLDNVISEVFKLSRANSKEVIEKGLVFVNGVEVNKPDFYLKDNSKLVFRGKGKAYFNSVVGESRKGNLYISITRYI